MDASRRTACLPNTRIDTLKFITDWVNDPRKQQNMLWLHGLAGSGKSTLATTIANLFGDSGRLGAFLFFDRDVTERSDPSVIVRTLAHQLAGSDPRIGAAIRAVVEKNSNVIMYPLPHQLRKLVIGPLETFKDTDADSTPAIVIVLDALDECGTADEREALLAMLANDFADMPSSFRTIVASRAENDIYTAFDSRRHILAHQLDLSSPANSDDILWYFRHHLTLVRTRKKHLGLKADWPGEEVLQKLVQRASGLFVWASTASAFIGGHEPRRRLDIILGGQTASGAQDALDALYKTALCSIGLWDDSDFISDFRAILGIILVARQPLSSTAIDALLQLPENRPSIYTISLLGCVLQQNPTVRVLHPSFGDFLMTAKRCERDMWFFEQSLHHRHLAFRCLDCMDAVMKQNMCNLTLSIDLASQTLSEEVAYSSVFWIDHICAIVDDIMPVIDRINVFLFRHLLHWFEAMSILRRSRDTISVLDVLKDWILAHSSHSTELLDLVQDACRFARVFASTIEDHPLLVYTSALPFSPITSSLYQTFHDGDVHPSIRGGFLHAWPPLLLVMVGHKNIVHSAAFSADGTRIVSGSSDNSIRIWHSTTGVEVLEMRGHEDSVLSVNFSPDGHQIVSGSSDCTVRVWDVTTGTEVIPAMCHQAAVTCVAFSPDGTMIASGSKDATIQIWDPITSAKVSSILACGEAVSSLAFSPDGSRIVSGCEDAIIRVWEVSAGTLVSQMSGHDGRVSSVAFSLNGRQIVSGSLDTTVRVWDAATGAEALPPLQGHQLEVMSTTFSPDATRIFSGSDDSSIRIWDATTGTQISELHGHTEAVAAVDVSSDGTRIVTCSSDDTILVWDAAGGTEVLPTVRGQIDDGRSSLQYPLREVCSVEFSPDGTKIVSGSNRGAIRLWDATTGVQLSELIGHEHVVWSVNFSPDGYQIVSAGDNTIRICDVTTGIQVFSDTQQYQAVCSVAFSLDGNRILFESDVERISWDVKSGHRLRPIEEPGYPLSGPYKILDDGWVFDVVAGRTLSKLPTMASKIFKASRYFASHQNSLAIGTGLGHVFVMEFPPTLLTSQDTRSAEGKGRLLEISPDDGLFYGDRS